MAAGGRAEYGSAVRSLAARGLPTRTRALRVDTPEQSRAMLLSVLDDEAGPARDVVVFNTGVALYAANVVSRIEDGMARAREALSSGAAKAKLDQLVSVAHELASAS